MTVGYQARLQYTMATVETNYGSQLSSLYSSYSSTGSSSSSITTSSKSTGSLDALNELLESSALKNKSDEFRSQFSELYKSIYNLSDDSDSEEEYSSAQSVKTASASVGGYATAIKSYADSIEYGSPEDFDVEEYRAYAQAFVDSYNEYIDKIGSSDNDTVLKQGVLAVNNAQIYSNSLKNAGITLGSDNKLTLSDDLSGVDLVDVKSAFGKGTFSDAVIRKARTINEAVGGTGTFTKAYVDTSGSSSSSASSSISNATALNSASNAFTDVASELKSYSDSVEAGTVEFNIDDYSALAESFAEKYNSLISEAANTDDSTITAAASTAASSTKIYSFALEKAGFTLGDDGKLTYSVDNVGSVEDVQAIYGSSYISKVTSSADKITSATGGTTSSTDTSSTVAGLSTSLQDAADALKSYSDAVKSGEKTFDSVEYTDTVSSYVDSYNQLLKAAENSEDYSIQYKASTLSSITNSYKYALQRAGIEVSGSGKLSLSEKAVEDLESGDVSYAFSGSYLDKIQQQSEQIYALSTSTSTLGYSSNSTASYIYTSGALYSVYA